MFYVYALGSMLSYTVQQTLLIRYARKIDGLSLAFYRNISFVVTLLPLLINAKTSDFAVMAAHWQMLALSGVCGAVYLALIYGSYAYLPAGICSSVSKAVATVAIVLFGWFLLGTGMMSMASSLGPIGIMNAISCGTLVVTSLLAWMWYHEKLSAGQWLSMLVILAGIVGLKFV